MKNKETYARQCDITKEGMNEGYCIQDGLMYIKYKKDMIDHLREVEKEGNLEYDQQIKEGRLTDDFLLEDYYQADYYYWTEWECEDDSDFLIVDEEDYDYVETKGCGETEVWEHCKTKEIIYVPVELKRHWHLASKKY